MDSLSDPTCTVAASLTPERVVTRQATQETIRIVNEHDTDIPVSAATAGSGCDCCRDLISDRDRCCDQLFFYVAFQVNHTPLEVPDAYIEKYPAEWREDRRWYAGMATYCEPLKTRPWLPPLAVALPCGAYESMTLSLLC